MKEKVYINVVLFIMLVLINIGAYAQTEPSKLDTFVFSADTAYKADSLITDSIYNRRISGNKGFGLLDSLADDTILASIFMPYAVIRNPYYEERVIRTNLPTVKEIKIRPEHESSWQFWIILLILLYIAFVRISNPNNFKVFILSVFNLKLSRKIWEDQRSFFSFVFFQLFAIYLLIASLFILNFPKFNILEHLKNDVFKFIYIFVAIVIVYAGKFFIHILLGYLLKMNNLAIGFISNTVSVNNFVALVIFPFSVLSFYINQPILAIVLSQTIIAIFFISVLYRVVRMILLSNSFFSFPTFYLFLYLCALEIAPWFIIVKFLNTYSA